MYKPRKSINLETWKINLYLYKYTTSITKKDNLNSTCISTTNKSNDMMQHRVTVAHLMISVIHIKRSFSIFLFYVA